MLQVIEIKCELLDGISLIIGIAVVHLSPPGDAWADKVPVGVEGDTRRESLHEHRTFGTRPNKTHVTFQYVPQLRYLVHPDAPQQPANASQPLIDFGGELRPMALRIENHGTELIEGELPAASANPALFVDRRAFGLHLHCQPDEPAQETPDGSRRQNQQNVGETLQHQVVHSP